MSNDQENISNLLHSLFWVAGLAFMFSSASQCWESGGRGDRAVEVEREKTIRHCLSAGEAYVCCKNSSYCKGGYSRPGPTVPFWEVPASSEED